MASRTLRSARAGVDCVGGGNERGSSPRAGVAATCGVLGHVGVPASGGSDQRMLALLVSRREASQLNWRVTDSLGFLVPSTHNCAASDSRFEVHYETAAAATCDHMKQPTPTCCAGSFMWPAIWRLIALCFASRPIESRYIWRYVTRSATGNGPESSSFRGVSGPVRTGCRTSIWVGPPSTVTSHQRSERRSDSPALRM